MDKSTHEARLAQWMAIIKACHESGQTTRSWCIENNVDEKKFYYWQRRIRKAACEDMQLLITSNTTYTPITDNARTTVPATTFQPDIVLKCASTTIQIFNSASSELLEKLLRIVNHVS